MALTPREGVLHLYAWVVSLGLVWFSEKKGNELMMTTLLTGTDASTLLAYLDPGLGSMQLQIVVAAILSATFYFKSSLIQAKSVIGRIWKKKD